jgi:hypothetical protein
MTDRPEWFAPKRFGYGSGWPISWQGWAITLGYVAIVFGLSLALHPRPVQLIAALALPTILFMVVCARTTRGGWRWRRGSKEDD